MTAWTIDIRPRPEPRLIGGRAAGLGVIVFLGCYGLVVSLGSLLIR